MLKKFVLRTTTGALIQIKIHQSILLTFLINNLNSSNQDNREINIRLSYLLKCNDTGL